MTAFRDLVSEITEDDVAWVVELMKLKELDAPRIEFLRSRETLDVSACPGSGKTTMVVAKLAILARKWTSRTRGICVLSHTNVARHEIEHRLGNTEMGQRLLSYPHYIDTIHGFVSRFLATPWLLSAGFRFTAIDDELTHRMRFNCISLADRKKVRGYFERSNFKAESLRLTSTDFTDPLTGNNFPCGPDADSYKIMAAAMGEAAKRGYFCYDEIFVLGKAQLTERPGVGASLRHRFPCVLVDEMQDTSDLQNEYLSTIFPREDGSICVTRVGDPNQAIFDSEASSQGNDFPDVEQSLDIASSFRFDESIALLANPFAFHPVAQRLRGLRAKGNEQRLPHTIFVFPDGDCGEVLDAYGRHVLQHLPIELLQKATITALGFTHKGIDPEDQDEHYPKTVAHYWGKYDRNAGGSGYKPPTLVERLRLARYHLTNGETAHQAVEEMARALIHLANLSDPRMRIKPGARQHVQVQQLLIKPDDLQQYQHLIVEVLFSSETISQRRWKVLGHRFSSLAKVLAATNELSEAGKEYLGWVEDAQETIQEETVAPSMNTYRCVHEQRTVDIKLGSVHSAKGQTHTATLVLETYNYGHVLNSLMPWMLGQQCHGGKSVKIRQRRRLLAMYVAMTRPTHLLCLAISRRSLGEGEAFEQSRQMLIDQGWNVHQIVPRNTVDSVDPTS
ncbi:UvrD-helicase domain-containing protein [Pseudomonas alliivorans]|nr:UvrD-helicase domain-containing protein [Pseudomonas alliivorans]MEE4776990.1 UvrD-helicase domain-containing protein [Pseudomonas alliivorans]